MPKIAIENPFVLQPPAPQNAVDLFAGEWASRFPADSPAVTAGATPLFEDPRLQWADTALRELCGEGFAGQSVLELGPLEGGHSCFAARAGAREILAIEANARAYLRCLVAREVVDIPRTRFLLGDALAFMRTTDRTFDLGLACAFLNHMVQPAEVIALLARCCRRVFVWNVVHSPALFEKQPELAPRFGPPQPAEFAGFRHTLHPHYYGEGVDYRTFRGGAQPSCCWMTADDVLAALRHFGFTRIQGNLEDNPFGKAICAVAAKP